jgi:arsenite-transporting ATPase
MRKIVMFTGKGGVGKTTVSVATALLLSQDKKILLISTDPAGSLSNIFNVEFKDKIVNVDKNLDVIELTRPVILKLWRKRFGDEVYTVVSSLFPVERDILDYLEGAPGLEEEFMLDYVKEAVKSEKYDHIVWDTAPTSATLNLLNIQYLFYSHLGEAQKLYLSLKGVFSKIKRRPEGEPLELIKNWRKLTEHVLNMLSTNASTWVVTNPERLPVEQALFIGKSITKYGIELNGYILNRIFPEDVCKGNDFLKQKREQQWRWKEDLIKRADAPVKIIPEMMGDITKKDRLLTIAHMLYEARPT